MIRFGSYIYRLTLLAFPSSHRSLYAAEMIEAFELALAARRREGGWRALAIVMAACADNVRAGLGERDRYRRRSLGLRHSDEMRFSWLDFKLGFRMLARYPGLTVVGGLAVAFAIWVGVGSFELINQWINPTLPLPEGERIVGLQLWNAASGRRDLRALHDFVAWRDGMTSVEELSAFRELERNLSDAHGGAEPVKVAEMTASAFRLARVQPQLGRFLLDSDESASAPSVIVLAHNIWQTRFDGDPNVIGRSVKLGKTDTTVVGVMPEAFAYPIAYDAWVPFHLNALNYERGGGPEIYVLGRLRDGISIEQAQAELTTFQRTDTQVRPRVLLYADSINPIPADELLSLRLINLFVVMLVVLVCSNVGLLMFARAATRETEIVVRNALGASRGRIIVQLFSEALVLCAIGAAVGLTAARFGVQWGMWILDANLGRLPFWVDDRLSWTTLLYALALTVFGAVIAGVVPALRMTRHVGIHLQQASAGAGGIKFSGLWTLVIVAQVAVTVAFPVSLFFIVRMQNTMESATVGFDEERFLSARLEADAPGEAQRRYAELDRQLSNEGSVEGVTFMSRLPRMFHSSRQLESGKRVYTASIEADFVEVLGAELLAGRPFNATDLEPGRRVVIVNKSFVDLVHGGRNAVGQYLKFANEPDGSHEIVGVVEDLAMNYLGRGTGEGVYFPLRPENGNQIFMVVKVRGDAASFAPRLREVANAVNPSVRLYDLGPMNEMNDTVYRLVRILITVALVVSGVALLLSLAGIYAVMSFAVSRRTREIGIRVALGAGGRGVLFPIFRKPLVQVGLGVVVGVSIVALVASEGIGFVIAYAALMMLVCMLACVVPTRRALRIQPTQALRHDG